MQCSAFWVPLLEFWLLGEMTQVIDTGAQESLFTDRNICQICVLTDHYKLGEQTSPRPSRHNVQVGLPCVLIGVQAVGPVTRKRETHCVQGTLPLL